MKVYAPTSNRRRQHVEVHDIKSEPTSFLLADFSLDLTLQHRLQTTVEVTQ